MKELENEIIDYAINKFNFYEFVECPYEEIEDHFSLERKDIMAIRNIISLAENYGLIEFSGNTHFSAKLILQGKKITDNGGWLKYLNEQVAEKKKEQERQNKNDQLLDLDLQLKKFENRIGQKILIAGFIITILSFIISVLTTKFMSENDKVETKKEIKTKQTEG